MPRTYSEKFLRELEAIEGNALWIRFAKACVAANLPASYVAEAMEVSVTTIHNWFRGVQKFNEHHAKTAEVFVSLVTDDVTAGRLPARNMKDAKAYIQDMIGVKN